MRTLWLFLLVPFSLAAQGTSVSDCQDNPGAHPINILYGDSQIKVVPPHYYVHPGESLRFRLISSPFSGPGGLDYGNVTVTIASKDAAANTWINQSGTDNTNGTLVACVPNDQPAGVVEYMVAVDQVGQLDPRAEVIH